MATARAQQAFAYYISRGYTPAQAAGIVGNLMQESGQNLDVNVVGDNGTAFGVAQWRGERLRNLHSFAASRGKDWRDFDTQLAFVDHELRTTEHRAGEALRNATTVADATAAMIGFERPQGWTASNPTGGHGWNNRLTYASQLAGVEPMAFAGAGTTAEGQAAITAAAGTAGGLPTPPPAPGSQPLFRPVAEARAAREAGGTPRLDEISSIIRARRMGDTPIRDRLRAAFQNWRNPPATVPTPPAPIPNVPAARAPAGGGTGAARQAGYDPAVEQLQRDLAAAGFDPGPIDGLMGPRTRAAMAARDAAASRPAPTTGAVPLPRPASVAARDPLAAPLPRERPGAAPSSPNAQARLDYRIPIGNVRLPEIGGPYAPGSLTTGALNPTARPVTYNQQANLDYGIPIAPASAPQITAPAPGRYTTGALTPTSYNPRANLDYTVPVATAQPERITAPPPGAYTTGALESTWPRMADNETMWTSPAWRGSPGAGLGVAAPVTAVERAALPAVRQPVVDPQRVVSTMPQVDIRMPGWGVPAAVASTPSGPGAGGRPVVTNPTTLVANTGTPFPRQEAVDRGFMPAGRDDFAFQNAFFRNLPSLTENPPTILPQGSGQLMRPVTSTTPPMPQMPLRATWPIPQWWRQFGAGV